MIYVHSPGTDVYKHFATEYYMMTEKDLGDDFLFLFWRTSPTVMIGNYQDVLQEVNMEYVKKNGIHVVRRLSGGGTIFTDEGGWQFSFLDKKKGGQISFDAYLEPILKALRSLGLDVTFTGRNDLTIDGKKFSGNAQYKRGGGTVHHGSLLFDTDVEAMVSSTTVDPHKIISKGIASVRERVTNLSEHMERKMTGEEFHDFVVDFVVGKDQNRYQLTAEDEIRINEIAKEMFESWDAIYGHNPACSIHYKAYWSGGKLAVDMELKHSRIKDIKFSGDFFGSLEAQELSDALKDAPYEESEIRTRLEKLDIENKLYLITLDEVVATIFDRPLEQVSEESKK